MIILSYADSIRRYEYRHCLKEADDKVYITALAEYIYHQCGIEPPVWVYEEQFYLSEPVYAEGVEALCKRFGKDNLKQIISEEAIPEFKKRNFMLSDVLSAV